MRHRQAKKILNKYTCRTELREMRDLGVPPIRRLLTALKPIVSCHVWLHAEAVELRRHMRSHIWARKKRVMDRKITERCPELAEVLGITLKGGSGVNDHA